MTNRRQMVLAAAGITALTVLPAAAYAGGGGSPPAPGASAAGSASAYCCTSWTDTLIGDGKNAIHVLTGAGCTAINDTAADRNSCSAVPGTTAKCRGELYTPGTGATGTVHRCFSP